MQPFGVVVRIVVVSASLVVASGIAIGTIQLPGVDILAIALAGIASVALELLGIPVSLDGAIIDVSGFLAVIAQQCTAIDLILVFSIAVLVCPVSLSARGWALLLGVPALCVLNLMRILNLLVIGIDFPQYLDIAHLVVWQTIMVGAAFAMCLLWLRWAFNAERNDRLAA